VVFVANFNENVGHSASELFGVSKIDALVGCVGVSVGTDQTKSNDEGLGVQATELGEEGD
jgi:hypothetical protein